MSLLFYAVCILSVVLGGLVLLVLYSLLVMAQRGDKCLDRLELEILKDHNPTFTLVQSENPEGFIKTAAADLYHGSIT